MNIFKKYKLNLSIKKQKKIEMKRYHRRMKTDHIKLLKNFGMFHHEKTKGNYFWKYKD